MTRKTTTPTATALTKTVNKAGIEVLIPDLAVEIAKAKRAAEVFKSYVIDNDELFTFVGSELISVNAQLENTQATVKRLSAGYERIRKEAVEGKQTVTNEFTALVTYLSTARSILKGHVDTYKALKERQRREEETRLRAEAEAEARRRRQEEEERVRKEAAERETESRRLREEADRVAAEGHAEEAELLSQAADIANEEGQLALQQGMEAVENIQPAAVVVTDNTPKLAGLRTSLIWRADITDVRAMCLAIGQGEIPVTVIQRKETRNGLSIAVTYTIDLGWFRDEARRKGAENFAHPGVDVRQVPNTAV